MKHKKDNKDNAVFQFTAESYARAVKTIERALFVFHQASHYMPVRKEVRETFEGQAMALEDLLIEMGARSKP